MLGASHAQAQSITFRSETDLRSLSAIGDYDSAAIRRVLTKLCVFARLLKTRMDSSGDLDSRHVAGEYCGSWTMPTSS